MGTYTAYSGCAEKRGRVATVVEKVVGLKNGGKKKNGIGVNQLRKLWKLYV